MDVVDIVLVLVIAGVAVLGLRLGALTQLLTFGGFWVGITLGALLSGVIVGSVSSPSVKAVVTVLLVMGLAAIIGSAGRVAGGWSNAALRRHHLGGVDSVLGVAVAVVAVLLTAWFVATLVSFPNSRFTWLSSAVQRSDILRTVDEVLPPVPSAFSHVLSYLSGTGLAPVFAGLVPPSAGRVAVPSLSQALSIGGPAGASTVKVLGDACGSLQEGSGFAVGKGLVVTNAHVVAGEPDTEIDVGSSGYRATPVLVDPRLDIAVLRTAAPLGPPLSISPQEAGRGVQGAVLGYPQNGPLTVLPAGVTQDLVAEGRDIYNGGLVVRRVLELDAPIRPGNSGGPLVGANGAVIGVVFSRSTVDPGVGYALATPAVLSEVQRAESSDARVSTGACVQG